jgi:hypothetical protein
MFSLSRQRSIGTGIHVYSALFLFRKDCLYNNQHIFLVSQYERLVKANYLTAFFDANNGTCVYTFFFFWLVFSKYKT